MTRVLFGWIGLPSLMFVIFLAGLFHVRPGQVLTNAGQIVIAIQDGMQRNNPVDMDGIDKWIIIGGETRQNTVIMVLPNDMPAVPAYQGAAVGAGDGVEYGVGEFLPGYTGGGTVIFVGYPSGKAAVPGTGEDAVRQMAGGVNTVR